MIDHKLSLATILKEPDVLLGQIILLVIIVLTAVQVVLRFVFSAPLAWPEELSAILLIWLTFIGAVALTRRNDHIRVELVEEFAGPRVAGWLNVLFDIATVIFLALIIFGGWDYGRGGRCSTRTGRTCSSPDRAAATPSEESSSTSGSGTTFSRPGCTSRVARTRARVTEASGETLVTSPQTNSS